jgi:tetratricopeptide (TPR) repeat protein
MNVTTHRAVEKVPAPFQTAKVLRLLGFVVWVLPAAAWGADPAEEAFAHGRYAEAVKLAEPAAQEKKAFRARLLLGRAFHALGQRDSEKAVWNRFYDDYEQGVLDRKSAKDLTYVALAARYLGGWQDANDTFRDAVEADPKGKDGARANIEWAALFLEKYDAGHAEQCLEEALKVLGDDLEARVLYARVKLEQGYDVDGAEKQLALALKNNPKRPNLGALAVRAEIELDDERFADVAATVEQIFKVNPEDLRARTILAASKLIQEDVKGYQAERDRVIKLNPRAGEFFHGVAEFLVKQHRYIEANQLEEEAVKADGKNWVALAAHGSNLLRLGDEKDGLAALKKAWDGDQYNVRTYNLLNLFEDVIPKTYTILDGKVLRWRVPISEASLINQYVRPMAEAEWAELVKRYGFTPETPVTIELYADPQHYAVRTVGLPGLEALGVTFGKVITGMSPQGGKFNWGMMLWHEVGHVFALQLSKARVPRWFTEGLSEYETARHDPTWVRRTHAELYRALETGKLPSIRELNAGFTRARDVSHIVVAYHESAEVVAFLIRRFGFEKIPVMLRQFAAGKPATEVLPAVTGKSLEELDGLFRADLKAMLKPYEGTFFVRSSEYSDVEKLKEQVAAHPKDTRATGLYALALVKQNLLGDAQKLVDATTVPGPEMLLAAAQVAQARKDRVRAHELYQELIATRGDGFDARLGLGQTASELTEAKPQFELAKKYDPDRPDPYLELAKLQLKSDEPAALKELEAAARLDVMDGAITKTLMQKYGARKDWAKVVEWGPKALFVDLYDPVVHKIYAEGLWQLGKKKEARAEVDAALACEPDDKLKAELKALLR